MRGDKTMAAPNPVSTTAPANPSDGIRSFLKLIESARQSTSIQNTADPTQPGAGIANMQYLLRQALGLNMATWIVDNASDHLGLGWLKHLQPFLFTIDRSVNPSNTVRIAMDSAYTYLVRAPMLRDLQRQYPIKTLGLTALAKLYARGAIDEQTYLDK